MRSPVVHPLVGHRRHRRLKARLLASGLSISQLVMPPGPRPPPSAAATSGAAPTARASASPRRRTGRSISRELARVLATLGCIRRFNTAQGGGKKISLGRPDRAGRQRCHRSRREESRHRRRRAFVRPGWTPRGTRPAWPPSPRRQPAAEPSFRNHVPGLEGAAAGLR